MTAPLPDDEWEPEPAPFVTDSDDTEWRGWMHPPLKPTEILPPTFGPPPDPLGDDSTASNQSDEEC